MPVKITSSERRTDTQLNSAPRTADRPVDSTRATTSGSPARSDRIAVPYPPMPASAPTLRNSWPVLPKITLKAVA